MALSVTVHGITVKTGAQTSGRLATADITTQNGLEEVLYTVPSSPGFDYAILAISVCNRDSESATGVSLAVADSDVAKAFDYIEWNTTLVPNGVLERTQIVAQAGQRIILRWGDAPSEIIPLHETVGDTDAWAQAVTGTGAVDVTDPDRAVFTLAEGDTASLTSAPFDGSSPLVDGETYRAAVSFYSTEVTGVGSSIVLSITDAVTLVDTALVTLGLEDRNQIDTYRTYTSEFTVDNSSDLTDAASTLRLDMADVNATVDRISLIKIS